MTIDLSFILRVIWSLTGFFLAVTLLWVTYRLVSHAHATRFSLKEWVADLASVNFRMVVALALFAFTILVLLGVTVVNAGGMFRAELDKDIVKLILLAEFGAMGWDTIGFIGKRVTFKPNAPDDTRLAAVKEVVLDPLVEPEPPVVSRNETDFTPRPS